MKHQNLVGGIGTDLREIWDKLSTAQDTLYYMLDEIASEIGLLYTTLGIKYMCKVLNLLFIKGRTLAMRIHLTYPFCNFLSERHPQTRWEEEDKIQPIFHRPRVKVVEYLQVAFSDGRIARTKITVREILKSRFDQQRL